MSPEELLVLLGWIPQEPWERRLVDDLVGALKAWDGGDDDGVRRWFRRAQPTLMRRTPLEALRVAKTPDHPLVAELLQLAQQPPRTAEPTRA